MTEQQFQKLSTAKKIALNKQFLRAKKRHFKDQSVIKGEELQKFMKDWLDKQTL